MKINPLKINDLDFIKIGFHKEDLKTGDIVCIAHTYYMTFINDDFSKYSSYYNFLNKENCEGLFVTCTNTPSNTSYQHMRISSFDNNLILINKNNQPRRHIKYWSIHKVYVNQDDDFIMPEPDRLTQIYLKYMINNFNYLKIELTHEF